MPFSSFSLGVGSLFVVIGIIAFFDRRKNAGRRQLPPGPPGLPLLGNINDMPKKGDFEAHHWLKHKDKYGPISSVTTMGQTLVFVNDARLALELLEKRSVKYSSRPKQVFAGELMGWKNTLAFQQNDSRFRAIRKNMSRIIGSNKSASQFHQLNEVEVGHFLLNVLDQPDHLVSHIERETGTSILKIAYGYTAESKKRDPLIAMAVEIMQSFAMAGAPYTFLVDALPICFQRKAQEWRATLTKTAELPYAFVKHQMARGLNEVSLLSQLLDMGEPNSEVQWANKWSTMSLYVAGSDTVGHTGLFGNQEEIDRVVGTKRLPSFSDRANLPYVNAIVKEVLRWAPIAPMGLPHVVSENDIVESYHIPKGAMVFPNIWYFLHNPATYHEPMEFKPERFLETDDHVPELDPATYAYGFGRRICPGRILADNTMFLNIAQCLAAFKIGKATRDGVEMEPTLIFQPGIVCRPAPFENTIKPRSPEHEHLIRLIEKTHPRQASDGETLQSLDHSIR